MLMSATWFSRIIYHIILLDIKSNNIPGILSHYIETYPLFQRVCFQPPTLEWIKLEIATFWDGLAPSLIINNL